MEIEIIVQNLAIGSGLSFSDRFGAGQGLQELFRGEVITGQQFETARGILDFCNRAIHGQNLNAVTALAIIEAVEPLMNDYKEWLYWNFEEKGPR